MPTPLIHYTTQVRLLEETVKVLGGNSRPPLQEPDYLYSWAKVGERAALSNNVNNTTNAAFALQLAGHRGSPGANASFASYPSYNSTAQLSVAEKGSKSRPGSMRGASLSPAPGGGGSVHQGTPPKTSSGFMVSSVCGVYV